MIHLINGHLAVIADGPPVLLRIGPLAIRWYALAYVGGVVGGWFLLTRMIRASHPPMNAVQLADFIVWAIPGVILGGRVGYVLFYDPTAYLRHPLDVLAVWQGGMSFHGGAVGLLTATVLFCRKNGIQWLRVLDYIVVVQPIGQGLGRLANFFNAELWGAPTSLPWGVIFRTGDGPRHPSQIYEFLLEGVALLVGLSWLFWRTDARRRPGLLTGAFSLGFGVVRMLVELVREPDAQLAGHTGPLQMGQWLSLPMIVLGVSLIIRAARRPLTKQDAPCAPT